MEARQPTALQPTQDLWKVLNARIDQALTEINQEVIKALRKNNGGVLEYEDVSKILKDARTGKFKTLEDLTITLTSYSNNGGLPDQLKNLNESEKQAFASIIKLNHVLIKYKFFLDKFRIGITGNKFQELVRELEEDAVKFTAEFNEENYRTTLDELLSPIESKIAKLQRKLIERHFQIKINDEGRFNTSVAHEEWNKKLAGIPFLGKTAKKEGLHDRIQDMVDAREKQDSSGIIEIKAELIAELEQFENVIADLRSLYENELAHAEQVLQEYKKLNAALRNFLLHDGHEKVQAIYQWYLDEKNSQAKLATVITGATQSCSALRSTTDTVADAFIGVTKKLIAHKLEVSPWAAITQLIDNHLGADFQKLMNEFINRYVNPDLRDNITVLDTQAHTGNMVECCKFFDALSQIKIGAGQDIGTDAHILQIEQRLDAVKQRAQDTFAVMDQAYAQVAEHAYKVIPKTPFEQVQAFAGKHWGKMLIGALVGASGGGALVYFVPITLAKMITVGALSTTMGWGAGIGVGVTQEACTPREQQPNIEEGRELQPLMQDTDGGSIHKVSYYSLAQKGLPPGLMRQDSEVRAGSPRGAEVGRSQSYQPVEMPDGGHRPRRKYPMALHP